MKILFYDTETTGLPKWKEPSTNPDQPHIVSVAALLVDSDTKRIHQNIHLIVDQDGWESEPEALAVHGITKEFSRKYGIPEPEAVAMVLALNDKADIRIAHSESFDSRIIRIGVKRYFDEHTAENWKLGESGCTMKMSKGIVPASSRDIKLVDAYHHLLGKELEGAHNAMVDCKACMDVYFMLQMCIDEGGKN